MIYLARFVPPCPSRVCFASSDHHHDFSIHHVTGDGSSFWRPCWGKQSSFRVHHIPTWACKMEGTVRLPVSPPTYFPSGLTATAAVLYCSLFILRCHCPAASATSDERRTLLDPSLMLLCRLLVELWTSHCSSENRTRGLINTVESSR